MTHALIAVQTWLADRDDRGASLVEYALLIVLIAVVCAVAITVLGGSASTSYSKTASGFTAN
jgi:Flp pilus assembly pilin Flp